MEKKNERKKKTKSTFYNLDKHGKNEVFHYSKLHGTFDPLPLNLSQISSLILKLKDS